jgi:hypothetical protein
VDGRVMPWVRGRDFGCAGLSKRCGIRLGSEDGGTLCATAAVLAASHAGPLNTMPRPKRIPDPHAYTLCLQPRSSGLSRCGRAPGRVRFSSVLRRSVHRSSGRRSRRTSCRDCARTVHNPPLPLCRLRAASERCQARMIVLAPLAFPAPPESGLAWSTRRGWQLKSTSRAPT